MDLDDFNSLWKAIMPHYDKKKGKYITENRYRMTAIKVFTLITKELNLFEGQAISNPDCFVFTGKIMELIENLEKRFYPSSEKKNRCIVCGRLNGKIVHCECNQELVEKYRILFKRFDDYIVALYKLGLSEGTSKLYVRVKHAFLDEISKLLNRDKKESE